MHLAGLPLSTLLTLGAVFGTLIVGLYILKLRRRPVAVPFSRIWQQVLRDKEATSLFSQLKRLLSLLLQLALVALLLLALGDPRTKQNLDRKSTRLNSSHVKISYAVFCLKKKNHTSL